MKKISVLLLIPAIVLVSLTGKGQGIKFTEGSFDSVKAKASKEKKNIFIDAYADWCGPCKHMAATTFKNDTVGDFFNKHFICYKVNVDNEFGSMFSRAYKVYGIPALLFLDSRGELLHRGVGMKNVKDFIELGKTALDSNQRFSYWKNEYDKGNRKPEFIRKYLDFLLKAGMEANEIVDWYFAMVKGEDLLNNNNIKLITNCLNNVNSEVFNYFVENKEKFGKICTDTIYYYDANDNKKILTGQKYIDYIINSKFLFGLYNALRNNDWKLYDKLYEKIKNSNIDDKESLLSKMDINKYQKNKDWNNYIKAIDKYLVNYGWDKIDDLNNYAWSVYENSKITNKADIELAVKWAKRSVELNSQYYNNDTYAAILYKAGGDRKLAIKHAKLAIELGKKDGIDVSTTEELLEKLKKK
ncbi:MAG: thioredoxin family protein [Bacteroidales bacterium]|nr:thioredoxin family protein [Bacteroidales bacterium]